ncbi:glycoside hydrolase family 10 protein [Actinocatenispora rupis]|uniref:Lipoprotein n=1 Tax=Actinocatenispora rupis TaxID=519421 RepID=A0A8J3NAB6_9ACTN|nr:family 10 glycosylhydrolase [Actinocatenispora rupis]GID09545.1 lipoprotein [Actinocatenispora rupis]
MSQPGTPISRRRFGALAAGTAAATTAAVLPGGSATAMPAGAATAPAGTAPGTADPNAPLEQLRAMWIASVVNIDWPSGTGLPAQQQRDQLVAWFDLAVRLNLNAVMLQVRPTADAFWPSQYEPWSQYLTGTQGTDPGYDPLEFAVAEAHKRNLQLHAWFNPYRVSMQTDPTKLVPWHPARQHPEWVFAYGPKLYYNPGIPEVRRFVEDAILDATRYDIDGVHFDDYFYPYPVAGETLPDADTYATYGAGFDRIEDWRRHNIDLLVSEMQHRIHAAKPWLAFGVSPFGIWRNKASDPNGSDTGGTESYDANFADTRGWVKKGWLDYINPQVYWNIGLAVADYAKLTPWWAEQVRGTDTKLYIGEATYKVNTSGAWLDPTELTRHLTLDQQYPEVAGNVYFSAKDVRTDALGATSRVVADHYQHPALTPALPHLDPRVPNRPELARARRTADGVRLDWVGTGSPAPASYAIFRFDGERAADIVDARNLVATVRADGRVQSWTDPTPGTEPRTYQVVAVSRTGVRSAPGNARTV